MLLLQCVVQMLLAHQVGASYVITFHETDPLHPTVTATVPVEGNEIHCGEGAIDHIPRGWAEFITDLKARQNNVAVPVTPSGKGHWKIDANGVVDLSYKVDLSFAKSKWPPGNEQAGILIDDGLFLVTKPLFVASKDSPSNVNFVLPDGWKVAAPWTPSGGGYDVNNQEQLLVNSLVVGKFQEWKSTAAGFSFSLVMLGSAARDSRSLAASLGKVAEDFSAIFPKTPPSRYLVTFFYADSDDGESYTQSAAFTMRNTIRANNSLGWANNMAHELFHFWNGHQIAGKSAADTTWLSEGFTEYYANTVLLRSRMWRLGDFLKKAERHCGNYLYWRASPAFKTASLIEAGQNKGADRFGLYDAGWCVALWLDLDIRQFSAGKRSLDDVMRALWDQTVTQKRSYTNADVAAIVSRFATPDAAALFEQVLSGKKAVPVEESLARIGITGIFQDYAGEVYLFPNGPETEKSRWLRTNWMSRNANQTPLAGGRR